jgi:lysozyme family protein
MLKEITYTIDKWEGDYSNDPDDPGGATRWGIAKKFHPSVDVKNLSKEGAVAIYKERYWDALSLDSITSQHIRWKVFDMAVNLGVDRAARFLQVAVGVTVDGKVGPVTISRTNTYTSSGVGEAKVMDKLIELQMKHYIAKVKETPKKIKYIDGWANRAFDRGVFV